MSVKKKSIEEKLSQCVFYNLSILKQVVRTTTEFDENLSTVNFFFEYIFIVFVNYPIISLDNVHEVEYKSLYSHHTLSLQHN